MTRKSPRRRHEPKADFPREEVGGCKSDPRQKWTPLRLKVWRCQMSAAARLRAVKRRERATAQVVVRIPRRRLEEYEYRALASRFTSSTEESMAAVSPGIRTMGGPPPSWRDRALGTMYAAYRSYRQRFEGWSQAVSGTHCLFCGGYHATLHCLDVYQLELRRSFAHMVSVRARLLDVATSEADREDDLRRFAGVLMGIQRLRASRLSALLWYSRRALPGRGVRRSAQRMYSLGDTLWFVATGGRFAPWTRGDRLLVHRLFSHRGLIEYMEGIMRSSDDTHLIDVAASTTAEGTAFGDTDFWLSRRMVLRAIDDLNFWLTFEEDTSLDLATARTGRAATPWFVNPFMSAPVVTFVVDGMTGLRIAGHLLTASITPGTASRVPELVGAGEHASTRSFWDDVVGELADLLEICEMGVRFSRAFLQDARVQHQYRLLTDNGSGSAVRPRNIDDF